MNWNYYFRYDPETGKLYWRVRMGAHAVPGKEVGGYDAYGYRKVKLHGKMYKVHRIIWDMNNPEDLLGDLLIDHINHVRDDNRLCNLRKVTYNGNRRNINPKYSPKVQIDSGLYGVFWAESQKRWVAAFEGKRLYQGPNFFEACCRRKAAEATTACG